MTNWKQKRISCHDLPKYGIDSLHPYEIFMIRRWRDKYRFGEMTIIVQEGIPLRIRKSIINDDPRDEKSLGKDN